jgi:hypothetical protein
MSCSASSSKIFSCDRGAKINFTEPILILLFFLAQDLGHISRLALHVKTEMN